MGVVAGGSSIGGVCLPIMFSRIIPKIGFGWSIRVAALLFLFCYLTAILISRTKPATKKAQAALSGNLLDFHGFKDPRYLTLAIGSFVASLGLYVPYYYIGARPRLHSIIPPPLTTCTRRILHRPPPPLGLYPQLSPAAYQRRQLLRPHHRRLLSRSGGAVEPAVPDDAGVGHLLPDHVATNGHRCRHCCRLRVPLRLLVRHFY